MPVPSADLPTTAAYIGKHTPKSKDPQSANWWGNRNKYLISYLKAIYGAKATKENDFGYAWLPKLDPGMNGSWLMIFDNMIKGKFKGFFAWGQNPACSGSNSTKVRNALAKLEWMVTTNLFDNETASFWKGPGMDPAAGKTEVFFLPAAGNVSTLARAGVFDEGATRVDTCQACSRYIKTRDSRKGGVDVPLEVEDLLTIHLDLLASREGFERGK